MTNTYFQVSWNEKKLKVSRGVFVKFFCDKLKKEQEDYLSLKKNKEIKETKKQKKHDIQDVTDKTKWKTSFFIRLKEIWEKIKEK